MKKILVVMNLKMTRLDSWLDFLFRFFEVANREKGWKIKILLPMEPSQEVKQRFVRFDDWYSVFNGWLRPTLDPRIDPPQNVYALGRYVLREQRRERYDLIAYHFCEEVSAIWVSIGARLLRVPSVSIWHQHSNIESLPRGPHLKRVVSRIRILSNVVDMICPVFFKQEKVIADRGVDKKKIRAIYNGIDEKKYQKAFSVQEFQAEIGISESTRVVLTIGSLIQRKRLDLFIRSARYVLSRERDIIFVIVGDGPLEDELRAMTLRMGISEEVKFVGRRNDVDRLLRFTDIFILCSDAEGFPFANLEACASGTAVISTDVSGVPELIENGKTGVLIPPGDQNALNETLLELLRNPVRCRELGTAARDLVFAKFTTSKMVASFVEAYELGFQSSGYSKYTGAHV